jgi:hypothetical protein
LLEDDALPLPRTRLRRAALGPDRQRPFAPTVRPAVAAVHERRAGPIADAAKRDGLGQPQGAYEATVRVFDPDRDLRPRRRREAQLQQRGRFVLGSRGWNRERAPAQHAGTQRGERDQGPAGAADLGRHEP